MVDRIVTKDSLQQMIDVGGDRAVRIVGRALVVLFERQTAEEKRINSTNVHNNVGFTSADGQSGVLSAKAFLKNKTLTDWQFERWARKNKKGYSRITKYWRQLDDAAKIKSKQQ